MGYLHKLSNVVELPVEIGSCDFYTPFFPKGPEMSNTDHALSLR